MMVAGIVRALTCGLAFLMLSGCATRSDSANLSSVRSTLAPTGVLRIAVHRGSPSSLLQESPEAPRRGVAFDIGRALAARLGVEYEVVVHGSNPEALAAVAEGRADFAFTNATPERAQAMDLARPVLVVHKSVLVPSGSRLSDLAALSRQPARVGALAGSTTAIEFARLYPLVTMVPISSLPVALRALRSGEIDALAANNAVLYELGDQLPGSTVLAGSWGSERFGIGVPKGRSAAHEFLRRFSESIASDGTLSGAVARAGLRGVDQP